MALGQHERAVDVFPTKRNCPLDRQTDVSIVDRRNRTFR
jgi:hypothetical protein